MKNHNLDPVHLAVLEHSVTDVRSAFSRGNEVDGLDRERRTPLFYAAKDGDVEIVSELLSHGANLNMRDKSLETPLHFAAREYRPEVAQRLLNAGATVDAEDIHGNTPLARAVYSSRGKGEMIKLLLSHGADKTLANKHGISAEKLAETIANYDVRQFMQ